MGLNLVCLTLLVPTSWGTLTLALPIGVRLYRKHANSHVQLAVEMLEAIPEWLPDPPSSCLPMGLFALGPQPVAAHDRDLAITQECGIHVTEFPHLRRPGRHRRHGDRLPSPAEMAADPKLLWRVCRVRVRGRVMERKLFLVRCSGGRPAVSVVCCWSSFETPLASTATSTCSHGYGGGSPTRGQRLCRSLGSRGDAPRLQAAAGRRELPVLATQGPGASQCLVLVGVLAGLVLLPLRWSQTEPQGWPGRPWYRAKAASAFSDALASARRQLWRVGI